MRCLLACLVVLGTVSGARARPPILPAAERARTVPAGAFVEDPAGRGRAAAARGDTIWFGGDDGGGVAFEGGVWDWEAIVADPLQGWTRVDATQNDAVHFARVSASSFAGDPCVPMIENTAGMLWCGVHEEEALCRGYATGMGYGNDFRQSARSPSLAIDWAQEALQIEFAYFNDTEPDYDYTHIYVLCYDAGGALVEERWVAGLTGVLGSAASPALFQQTIAAGTLSPLARSVALELRMVSDGGWSDEDGLYDSACGPFAADEVVLRVGAQPEVRFDFDDGPQGWDFAAYPGLGAYMTSIPEEVWRNWIPVPCGLSGRVLGFVDPQDRRHPGGHHEFGYSAPLPRGDYGADPWNAVVARGKAFSYSCGIWSVFYRYGYSHYPFSLPGCPDPAWSPPRMDDTWFFISVPQCTPFAIDLTELPDPPPADWDSLRLVIEVLVADQEPFYDSNGAPLFDDIQLGLTHKPDGPRVALKMGHRFHDGFGQRFPGHLEPGDTGNADIAYDLSLDGPGNDRLADSLVIEGPPVTGPQNRWLAELCLRVARAGPRQAMIPAYAAWKSRLREDPEDGFVAVLMDSVQTAAGVPSSRAFATYFHEDDPGFDPGRPDYGPEQEILPDGLFTPGTRIEYFIRAYWHRDGVPPADYFRLPEEGAYEFEILPGMTATEGYDVVWPSILYINAQEGTADRFIGPVLDALLGRPGGGGYDRYDYLDANSCWNAPMMRSRVGGVWGTNGCTPEQLLGYRLILLNTGAIACGAMEAADFELLEEWLTATACGLGGIRRGLILDGDQAAEIVHARRPGFLRDLLGVELLAPCYHEHNADPAYCVYLEPAAGGGYPPPDPGPALWGSGHSPSICFDVLGVRPGVAGVAPTLRYWSYGLTGMSEFVDYAQIVRAPAAGDWRTLVNGFSLHRLSLRGFGGLDCSSDSASIAGAALQLLAPVLDWLEDPADPFLPWRYPCQDAGLGEQPRGHLAGAVTYLYAPRPSPFSRRAELRFRVARPGAVRLDIFDLAGRRVRALLDGSVPAGEQGLTWDGTDDQGRRLAAGAYWVQLRADDHASSRRLLMLP